MSTGNYWGRTPTLRPAGFTAGDNQQLLVLDTMLGEPVSVYLVLLIAAHSPSLAWVMLESLQLARPSLQEFE